MSVPDPECPACGGPTRITARTTYRATVAVVARCAKCGRQDGRLTPGPDDPPNVHRFVRKQMNKMLGTRRPRRSTGWYTTA